MTETRSITIAGQHCQIGPLTLLQIQAALAAYERLESFVTSGDIRHVTPDALSALAEALAAITGQSVQAVARLPLDQFITAVTDAAEAVVAVNTAYLEGPVAQALQRLSATLASQALLRPAPAGSAP